MIPGDANEEEAAAPPADPTGAFRVIWGYCGACERWRCSDRWTTVEGPACPVCGSPPLLLERLEGGRAVLRLDLEVAVGPVGRRSFLTE